MFQSHKAPRWDSKPPRSPSNKQQCWQKWTPSWDTCLNSHFRGKLQLIWILVVSIPFRHLQWEKAFRSSQMQIPIIKRFRTNFSDICMNDWISCVSLSLWPIYLQRSTRVCAYGILMNLGWPWECQCVVVYCTFVQTCFWLFIFGRNSPPQTSSHHQLSNASCIRGQLFKWRPRSNMSSAL